MDVCKSSVISSRLPRSAHSLECQMPAEAAGASWSGGEVADCAEAHRTHHLLKHCLSTDQKGEALRHFSTVDVKEAAKDISRMGQRELQSKFKCVYGSVTHSNNNDWLRRKLYEAIGAAPLKSATKGKSRKGTGTSKSRRSVDSALPHYQHNGAAQERKMRSLDIKSSGSPTTLQFSAAQRLKRGAVLASPLLSSVMDVHRFPSSNDTTTSESEDGSRDAPGDLHHQSTDCDTPRSARAASVSLASPFSQPVHIRPVRTHVGLVPVRPVGSIPNSAPGPSILAGCSPIQFVPHSAFPTGMHQCVSPGSPVPVDLTKEYSMLQGQPGSLGHALQASRCWSQGTAALLPSEHTVAAPAAQPVVDPEFGVGNSEGGMVMDAWSDLAGMSLDLKSTLGPRAMETTARLEEDDDVMLLQLDLSAFDDEYTPLGL